MSVLILDHRLRTGVSHVKGLIQGLERLSNFHHGSPINGDPLQGVALDCAIGMHAHRVGDAGMSAGPLQVSNVLVLNHA